MSPPIDDLLTGALILVVRRLTAAAASESLYGEITFTDEDVAQLWELPIAFDPRFDLDDRQAPLVIDQVTQALAESGGPPGLNLHQRVRSRGLASQLQAAETIRGYLEVLKKAVDDPPGPTTP